MKDLAIKKLDKELAALKGDRHVEVMKGPVHDALVQFCQQSEEFAQAVLQGRTFGTCMQEVAKGAGSALSDLEAYRRAVQFYFPGADIRCEMTIRLSEYDEDRSSGVVLDLFDLMGGGA